MNFTRAVLVSSLLCLVLAPAAQASTEFTFGMGKEPDIAVDAAGTAHVAWHDASRPLDQDVVLYCQIPRGARACSNTQTLYTGSPGALPHVLLPSAGQVVVILGHEECLDVPWFCTIVRQSDDGGATFNPVQTVADPDALYATPSGQAVAGPILDTISWVNNGNPDVLFTNAPLTGAAAIGFANLDPDASAFDANLGLHGATPVVVWMRSGDGILRWRAYDGSGDLNSVGNWTPTATIEAQSENDATLAGGPGGLFLLYERGAPGSEQIVSRKFTGSGWTEAAAVSELGGLRVLDLSQDASGRLHAVYINNDTSPDYLQWRTSTDGVNWSPPVTINASEDMFPRLSVAAAADGQGFATWDSGVGPNGALSDLRAVPLEQFDFPPDTTPPTIGGFGIGDPTLKPGQGTTFSFTSSKAGNAVLTFQKRVKGLKLKQKGKRKLRCVPQTKKKLRKLRRQLARKLKGKKLARALRKRRCKAFKKVGEIRQTVVEGQNTIEFTGRVAGRKLTKGRYRALLVVTDTAGNVSRTERLDFRVIGKKKKRRR